MALEQVAALLSCFSGCWQRLLPLLELVRDAKASVDNLTMAGTAGIAKSSVLRNRGR